MDILGTVNSPLTVSALTRMASEKLQEHISWNTVEKYIRELVDTNRVQPISLPHSKQSDKQGLTVYTLKK